MDRARRLFLNPLCLVALTAFLTALVVQSGELGTSDTTHRLQAAHSWWTSEPEVDPADYPVFGIHGPDGKLHGWYGIGQSLLMLPADIVGTYVERLPIFEDYDDDPTVGDIVVSYTTNILVCILTALVCWRLLRLLGFTVNQRIAGVLALLFCTTFLHYTQNMTENNYILLLTLTGLAFQYEWLSTGSSRALLIGSLALGANLLTRLTTGMDLLAVGLFLLLTAWFTGVPALRSRLASFARIAVPVYAIFGLIDRVYQHHRFGSYFNTYIQLFGREQKMLNPALPAAYPFETPFHVGFFGALFTPEKSIFLFDPLLVLTAIVAVLAWKRFRPEIKAYLVAFAALVLAYISFYAKFTDWSGDFAWGDRYVSPAAQIVAFVSVPLLLRHRADVGKVVWKIGIALVAVSVVVQLASVMFWCPLEIYQMDTLGHPTFVVALRLKNIVAFSLGKMNEWGLDNDSMKQDPWDYVHITTFNFLPFLLARVGKSAGWVVHLLTALWLAALAALVALLIFIRGAAAGIGFHAAAAPESSAPVK
ncbi:MAG TPA: hypothetical protein VN822_12500 [Candidatus Acidoferrales bacterium]|nr:hypothetical protein [Candidatus Acidoferrales bacterium]